MDNRYDKYVIPDISFEGLDRYVERMQANRHYTNFGPLCKELAGAIHSDLGLSDTTDVHCLNSGHGAIELVSRLAQREGRNRSIALFDVGFFTQYNCAEQFFEKRYLLPSLAETMLPDVDFACEWLSKNKVDVLYLTAVYGQDVSEMVRQFQDVISEDCWILIDCANAYLTTEAIEGVNIFTVYSLHATKNFGVGEGGVLLAHKVWAQKLWSLQNFGIGDAEEFSTFATNAKFAEMNAAIGLINLPRVRGKLEILRDLKVKFDAALSKFPCKAIGVTSLMLRFEDANYMRLAKENLIRNNVQPHYMYLRRNRDINKGYQSVGNIRAWDDMCFGLPFHTLLSDEDVEYIARSFE